MKLTDARLVELRGQQLPRVNFRDVIRATDGTPLEDALPTEDIAALDAYFQRFVDVATCICCGRKQGGTLVDQLLGEACFTWGLTHGEGYCRNCGYPARAYHRDVGPIQFIQAILQYHPDELMLRAERKAQAGDRD